MKAWKKILLLVIAAFILIVVYFAVKIVRPVGVPVEIFIDSFIPFVPAFVIPYVIFFPFLLLPWILFWKNDKEYKTLACAVIIGLVIANLIFLAYQTSGPRGDLQVTDGLTWMISQIYATDANVNAFPSIHTLMSALTGVFLWVNYKKKPLGYGSLALAILIIMSTVLIKQHGIIDIFGGLAVAGFAYWVARRNQGRQKFTSH